jgi:hypothetical protein
MPPVHAFFFFTGIVALILSWLLLLIYSSREDFTWGLFTVLLPPLAYLYGLFRWDKAKEPILLAVVGCVLVWIAVS